MSFDVRAAARRIIEHYLPSVYGDALFAEIVDGRWSPGYGTTCAYLVGLLLYLLGVRDPRIVNRDDHEQGLTTFRIGQGISVVYFGGRETGAWVDDAPGLEPELGDIYYMTDGLNPPDHDPNTEHVGVFWERVDEIHWRTADAGQGSPDAQRAEFVTRTVRDERASGGHRYLSSPAGGERRLMGWISLTRVALTAAPSGPAAETEEERSVRPHVAGVVVGAALLFGAMLYAVLRAKPATRYNLTARRGFDVAEYFYQSESEALDIERVLRASGWSVVRVETPSG